MKIFFSYSGAKSKGVAEALDYLISKVLPSIEIAGSHTDIAMGAIWRNALQAAARESDIAIVKERVTRLSSERLRKTTKGQIALTERQMNIVEFINQNGRITNRDIREMFKISDRAALKEIRKLADLNVIKTEGKGRGLRYVLA